MVEGFVHEFLWERFYEKLPFAQCHREWWQMMCRPERRVAFAAPRGCAKTTTQNHSFGLAQALFRVSPFQLKVSASYELACERILAIKNEIEENEKLRLAFDVADIVRDRENDIIVQLGGDYQFRVVAIGMMQKTRGKAWGSIRPSSIDCDDIEDDEEVLNKETRVKQMQWFMNKLLPMGGDSTRYRVYGTILHVDSLLSRLLKMKGWVTGKWEACDADVSEHSLLWPEKFSKERLQEIKEMYISEGNLIGFNMEYRNLAVDTVSGYIQPNDFQEMSEASHNAKKTFYVGGDLAISQEERRDHTVFQVGGLEEDGYLDMVDLRRGRWDALEIIEEMFSIQETWQPEEWFIENGKEWLAIKAPLEQEMRKRGIFMQITPMVPTKDKMTRGRSFQKRMRTKSVYWDAETDWYPDAKEEILQFRGKGEANDIFDSCAWLCIGIDLRGIEPLSEEEEDEEELMWARLKAKQETPTSGPNWTGYSR